MSVHVSLTLEASEMFLHMNFSLERAAVVGAILKENLGTWSFVREDCPKVLEVLHFF